VKNWFQIGFKFHSYRYQEELSSCFHLPSEAACRKLGIGLTVLKRQCRKFGIKRWPFRKMKSLDRLITNVQAGISPGGALHVESSLPIACKRAWFQTLEPEM
jgi:hypothetical protein